MLARKPWFGGGMLALVLTAILGTRGVRAQDAAALPPAPVPVGPAAVLGAPELPPAPPPLTQTPLTYTPPPPLLPAPPTVDPGPNGWAPYEPPSSPPGYFLPNVETVLLLPVLKDRITNDVGLAPSGNQLHVPSVSLDLTVSPEFEFGYRLPDSAGFFAGSYRYISSQGTGTSSFDGASFATRTRVDVEAFDLDYGTAMYEAAPNYLIGWRVGASVQNIFFDSRIQNALITQQASNNFFGSGAHLQFDVERRIEAVHGLALFGRLDGTVLIGQLTQHFTEEDVQPDGSTKTSVASFRHSQSVPILRLQAGVSYIPPIFTNVKFTTGYQFEDYWYLGQFNTNATPGTSRGELQTQGWFLRAQVDF